MSVSVTIDAITRNVDVTVSNQRGTPGVDGAGTWNDLTGTAPVIPFEPVPAPSHEEGLLFYDENDKSLTYYNDEADVAMNIGREMWIRIRNDSGAAILNGKVVYINDAQGQFPTIRLARADTAISSRVIGIATHDIGNNEFGYVTTVGEIKGLNTNAFDDGDLLFLSAVTAGEMTITAPLAPNRVVQVATVIHAHPSQGKLYCHPENDSIPSTGIVDSTATGRALITAANAAAGRTTLGLADGTATLSLSSASTASLTVATSLTLNATTYVYGTGAAAAHRTALGLGESDSPTLRGLTLARDGSNSIAAAVGSTGSLIWTYAGTGSTLLHNANRAGTFTGEVRNSSTDTNAGAAQVINTLGTGDAYTRYTVSAGSWTAGIDNSDGDKYKIGVGATVDLSTRFEISTTGESRFFGSADVQRTSDSTNFERVGMRWDSTTAKVGTSSGGSSPGRDLVLEANSIERQRILASNGNHGIGTQAPASRLSVAGGDIEVVDSASGIILKSPDGTRWRVTISNAGGLSATSITPP